MTLAILDSVRWAGGPFFVGPWVGLFWLPIVLLFWTGMVFLWFWVCRSLGWWRRGPDTAQDVLGRRFARGEISREEYEHAREIL